MKTLILLAHGLVDLPNGGEEPGRARMPQVQVATLLANLAYYGYCPSLQVLERLNTLSSAQLDDFWSATEPSLKQLTGDDRQMGDFVVYKNFPREVLSMSEGQYWFNQILMYLGAPNEWLSELPQERAPLDDRLKLKALALAPTDALTDVFRRLVANTARWSQDQADHALYLVRECGAVDLDLGAFGFKENGISLMAQTLGTEGSLTIADATDVLRLGAVMSGADAAMREKFRFRAFSRAERRLLLSLLDESKNLLADMGLRPALWKRFLVALRPGDYKFLRVIEAYHALYQGEYATFNGEVEAKLAAEDVSVLTLLKSRPGEFARRLHKLYASFGLVAVLAFREVAPKLNTTQLLKLRAYLATVNGRAYLIHPPKGNWTKARVVGNDKAALADKARSDLLATIDGVLAQRLARQFPQGVALADETADIKLQTNDSELASYGRGTVFRLPADARFVRTASFWQLKSGSSNWFDNSWNMFSENWAPVASCCWNETHSLGGAAVFSGDPTNAKDLKGRACQMIDLDLDALAKRGVRYAVWNILCYSRVSFDQAEDVLATLQWGDDATKGKLYEPARAQMVFPLKGANFTKYVAYLDVVERKLVYMDANFKGDVSSASRNQQALATLMPAFVEYLASLPSVADLFMNAPQGAQQPDAPAVAVLYDDAQRTLEPGAPAYVFRPSNAENQFAAVALEDVLRAA